MDELVGRIVANVGIERPVAERAVGIILDFLATEGPADKVPALLARLPGSTEAIAAARRSGRRLVMAGTGAASLFPAGKHLRKRALAGGTLFDGDDGSTTVVEGDRNVDP